MKIKLKIEGYISETKSSLDLTDFEEKSFNDLRSLAIEWFADCLSSARIIEVEDEDKSGEDNAEEDQ
jgi:hypothetical protein